MTEDQALETIVHHIGATNLALDQLTEALDSVGADHVDSLTRAGDHLVSVLRTIEHELRQR